MNRSLILILGGSFDPVHNGHIALAEKFIHLFNPTQLRLIPTGQSLLKAPTHASVEHRVAMLSLAFAHLNATTSIVIDHQEIERAKKGMASYSVDTLTQLRTEVGETTSLVFLIGADQLQQLQHWKNWPQLFGLTHMAVAARPGFQLTATNPEVADQFQQRKGSVEQLKNTPYGHTYLYTDLSIAISSTQIRRHIDPSLIPSQVFKYIQQHHLY